MGSGYLATDGGEKAASHTASGTCLSTLLVPNHAPQLFALPFYSPSEASHLFLGKANLGVENEVRPLTNLLCPWANHLISHKMRNVGLFIYTLFIHSLPALYLEVEKSDCMLRTL